MIFAYLERVSPQMNYLMYGSAFCKPNSVNLLPVKADNVQNPEVWPTSAR